MICFDTTPLIWGIKSHNGDDDSLSENLLKMKRYLQKLAEENQRIMIPTVVLAEYLVKIPAENHADEINLIQSIYRVFPFDTKAASRAASLVDSPQYQNTVNQYSSAEQVTKEVARQLVKVDIMIIATAVANNAERIISSDPHLRSIAGTLIPVESVPSIDVQLDLGIEQE